VTGAFEPATPIDQDPTLILRAVSAGVCFVTGSFSEQTLQHDHPVTFQDRSLADLRPCNCSLIACGNRFTCAIPHSFLSAAGRYSTMIIQPSEARELCSKSEWELVGGRLRAGGKEDGTRKIAKARH
jgi:hypothetical protein